MPAFDSDDLEPRRAVAQPPKLETLSIDELETYITRLEGEIARVRETIAAKRGQRGAAESVFKF